MFRRSALAALLSTPTDAIANRHYDVYENVNQKPWEGHAIMAANAAKDGTPNGTSRPRRNRMKSVLTAVLAFALALTAFWFLGPREPDATVNRFDPATIGDDLDAYVSVRGAAVPGIKDTAAPEIVWAFPQSKARTPVSLVYLHGFSASKGETRPMPDIAARLLSANLFYTRLAGHGLTGEAMAGATVQDWYDDTAEAIAIGNRLGEKTILVTTSTGGTLAALAAADRSLAGKIAGIVFISPNFGLKASGSSLLTMPLARQVVPLLIGAERSFTPSNDLHRELWTHTYPSSALLPMAAAVRKAAALPFHDVSIPALFIFSDQDQVVDAAVTRKVIERWGGPTTVVNVDDSEDPYHHVIAGDALSPSTSERLATALADWVSAL